MMGVDSQAPFAAALIAGGKSRRMGRDKAWLDWHGEPLWQMQLHKLAQLQPATLILSCRAEQKLAGSSAELLFDPPDNQGPLPALARCLEHAQKPTLALAVDMPHVTIPLLEEIVTLSRSGTCGVIFRGAHGYEPLCACYPYSTLPLLQEVLTEGNLRLQDFAGRAVDAGLLHVIPLSKEREALFLNLNSPSDLP